jgi:toxin-antitoxin system PIN domain toxin
VILVDANLLVYAGVASLPQHSAAKGWLDDRLNGAAAVGLPWPALLSFIRLVSNPRIFSNPQSISSTWEQVEAWLQCPCVWIPAPTDRHRTVIGALLRSSVTRANLVPDAHLAALAIEHGLTLFSSDGDFGRFPGLKWENPLR